MTLVQIEQCLGMYRTATLTAHTPLIILSVYKYMWNIYNCTNTNNPLIILSVYRWNECILHWLYSLSINMWNIYNCTITNNPLIKLSVYKKNKCILHWLFSLSINICINIVMCNKHILMQLWVWNGRLYIITVRKGYID